MKHSTAEAITPLDAVSATLVQQPAAGPKLVQQVDPASAVLAALGATVPRIVRPPRMQGPALDRSRQEWIRPVSNLMDDSREVDEVEIGSPPAFQLPPEVQPTQNRGTSDTGSSWGRTQKLFPNGAPASEMVRLQLDRSEVVQVYIDVLQPPGITPPGPNAGSSTVLTVWAKITYGGGSATATQLIDATGHVDFPLCVSFLSIACYLGDQNGVPVTDPGATNFAQVAVSVCRGSRGLPWCVSRYLTSDGSNARLSPNAVRLLSVQASLDADQGAAQWLMLFNDNGTVTPATTKPIAAYPLGNKAAGPGLPLTRFLNPRSGFPIGLVYGVSSTPSSGGFTPSGAGIHIEAEIQQL